MRRRRIRDRDGRYTGSHDTAWEERFTYKSKVISRDHAEFWSVDKDVYLRDTRSQSGTFLNTLRLSEPGKECKPYKLKAGDVLTFGVDYKGAKEEDKSITVRVDIRMVQMDPKPGHEGEYMEINKIRTTLTGPAEAAIVNEGNQQGMKNVMLPPPLPDVGQPSATISPGLSPMNMAGDLNPRMIPGVPMPLIAQRGTDGTLPLSDGPSQPLQ